MKRFKLYTITDTGRTHKAQSWELHASRCTHIRKGMKQKINSYSLRDRGTHTPEGLAEFVANAWIDPDLQEMGYTTDDVQIMACAMNPPVKEVQE